MQQKFVIPGHLPDMNLIIRQCKSHWGSYASIKKKWTYPIVLMAKAALKPIVEYPIDVKYVYYCCNRRKDPSNIDAGARKIIEDALQKAGIVTGDGWREIRSLSSEFYIDKAEPRIEVTLSKL